MACVSPKAVDVPYAQQSQQHGAFFSRGVDAEVLVLQGDQGGPGAEQCRGGRSCTQPHVSGRAPTGELGPQHLPSSEPLRAAAEVIKILQHKTSVTRNDRALCSRPWTQLLLEPGEGWRGARSNRIWEDGACGKPLQIRVSPELKGSCNSTWHGNEPDHSCEGQGERPTCKSQGSLGLSHLTWEKGPIRGREASSLRGGRASGDMSPHPYLQTAAASETETKTHTHLRAGQWRVRWLTTAVATSHPLEETGKGTEGGVGTPRPPSPSCQELVPGAMLFHSAAPSLAQPTSEAR